MSKQVSKSATRLALGHYMTQLKREWLASAIAFILPGIGTVLVFYIPPLIIAKIISRYSQGNAPSTQTLTPYVLLFVAVWALGELLWRIALHFTIKLQIKGINRLYEQAMQLLIAKDLNFFDNNFAGSLTKKVVGYSWSYVGLTDAIIFSVCTNAIPLVFASVILWTFSPWLVLGLVGSMTLTLLVVAPLIKRRQKLVDVREVASNKVSGNIADTIGNMQAVRTFAHESYEMNKHKELVKDFASKAEKSWMYQNLRIEVITSPLYVLANALGLILALSLSQSGSLNIEAIFIAFSYYTSITRIVWEFNNIYRNIESNLTEAAQFTELLNDTPTITDDANAEPFEVKKPSVALRNMSFRYMEAGDEHLFNDLNLLIEPGEKIGLVGPSGGGKTTIAKLLLRIMDVTEGHIAIDGRDIKTIRQQDLRRYIGYVPQDPLLFHRSLADNIRYGNLEATQAEIEKAAKLAYADEFIQKLPESYNTLVGERGVKLSGGQRQRIAIARAILKGAPILVLDEATSALDSESESLIQAALTNLMQGRTTVVIAHRLSTIQKMDRIVVLEDGVITEQGNHKELLEKKGLYAKLWDHQSGGFLED